MPDHLHLIWMGLRRECDQLNAMKFLRSELKSHLNNGRDWQHQAHDHVLREEDRRCNAFAAFCFYTLANPVREKLVESESQWPFSGCVIPGYPRMNPFQDDYWELFWKLYQQTREAEPPQV